MSNEEAINKIIEIYGVRVSPGSKFHDSILEFYKKKEFLTPKQVYALNNPPKNNRGYNSYFDDDREDDSLQAMAYDHGSQ